MNNILSTFAAIQPHNMISANEEQLQNSISRMTNIFNEISEEEVKVEIMRLRRQLEAAQITTEDANSWTILQFLRFLSNVDFLESLPNLVLCLRLFDNLCINNIMWKEFLQVKVNKKKNYLRSTMSQARLNSLAIIISIENEHAQNVNFDHVINKFGDTKARKVLL